MGSGVVAIVGRGVDRDAGRAVGPGRYFAADKVRWTVAMQKAMRRRRFPDFILTLGLGRRG